MPRLSGVSRLPGLLLLAALASGCALKAAEPAPPGTIQVPATAGEAGGAATSSDTRVAIDPNVVSYDDYRDPLMPMNRFVFGFNDLVSRYALIPLGKGYTRIVPDAVENRVGNFFYNVASPVYAVNNLLQARPGASGRNLLRFGINSTVGVLGLFDPARSWFELEREPADFAVTLAHYEVGYGVYLVLPFFGPSDLRNGSSRIVDYFLHPIPYVLDNPESSVLLAYGFFHDFAQSAGDYETLRDESEDPYIFLRNLYLQSIQRDAAYR